MLPELDLIGFPWFDRSWVFGMGMGTRLRVQASCQEGTGRNSRAGSGGRDWWISKTPPLAKCQHDV